MIGTSPVASLPVASTPSTIYAVTIEEALDAIDLIGAGNSYLVIVNEELHAIDIVNAARIPPAGGAGPGAVIVIDPRFMGIETWSAMTTANLAQYGFAARFCTEEGWQDWAQRIRTLPQLTSLGIPDPRTYGKRWREWGYRLNEALLRL